MRARHTQVTHFLATAMAVIGLTAAAARAQDDLLADERLEIDRNDDRQRLLDLARERQADAQRLRMQAAYKAQFDRWVASQFRSREELEMLLVGQVRKLTAQCQLREDQAKKLQLAGHGDIKRFMDRIEHVAKIMDDSTSSIDDLRAARIEIQALRIQTLRTPASERLFGEDSLLGKTLTAMLDPHQASARRAALFEQNRQRHKAAIESAAKTLQTNLNLSDRQRDRLTKLLLKETRPPRKFGTAPDVGLVLFQLSQISEEKTRPIFDDAQWRIVSRWTASYIRGSSGEKSLTFNGFVFDDQPGPADQNKSVEAANKIEDSRRRQLGQPLPKGSVP
jgi:hypothetical protein